MTYIRRGLCANATLSHEFGEKGSEIHFNEKYWNLSVNHEIIVVSINKKDEYVQFVNESTGMGIRIYGVCKGYRIGICVASIQAHTIQILL